MRKAVAYKRLKKMENYKTVTPKGGRGRSLDVETTRLPVKHFGVFDR